MKYLSLSIAALAIVAFSTTGVAASKYSPLVGDWNGKITTNLKDTTGGGNPTAGTTGTPVGISFKTVNDGLVGTSDVGGSKERWKIEGETYSWNDGTMTVSAKAMAATEVPAWVKKEAGVREGTPFFAFKYSGCTLNKTNTPCKIGEHLPTGIDTSGIWLFTVLNDTLTSNVYYTYATGGKRILEQSLTRARAVTTTNE